MAPVRCNVGQGNQHEGALRHPRMRQNRRSDFDLGVVVDQIEIERTRRVLRVARAPEGDSI